MTMHPELQRAIDANVSALEIIEAFTKHHSGVSVREKDIELLFSLKSRKLHHSDMLFWETWQPLLRGVGWLGRDPRSAPPSKPFLSIHKDLTKEIISWLCDSQRRSNVHLIFEAQTQTRNEDENYRADAFAAICYKAHRFGLPLRAAYLDRSSVFPLSITLAAYYPQIRPILTQALIDYPAHIEKPARICLKKHILEPWKILHESHPQHTDAPPVIVLRWEYERQNEFFNLIYELASSPHTSPLLWIISVNPKLFLPIHGYLGPWSFQHTRLPICYKDASMDTALFLRHRFHILRQKHKEMFDEDEVWPSEEQMSRLCRIFLGAFDSIDVVENFVDWEGGGGPKAHLETFLAYMVGSPSPSEEQPYCALDHFYTRAFAATPPRHLLVVTRLLGAFYGVHSGRWTALQLACLFSLAPHTVLHVLPRFCRWALNPESWDHPIFYSICPFFQGFLEDANRSRNPYIRALESELGLVAYRALLHVLSHSPNLITLLRPGGPFKPTTQVIEIETLMDLAVMIIYRYGHTNELHLEWTLLLHFDFRCLAHFDNQVASSDIFPFLIKLHAWGINNLSSIVRTEPLCALDRQFIDKCAGVATPLDLETKAWWLGLRLPGPKYALLGLEARTVLVLLVAEGGFGHVPGLPRYTIYTSAMLDYM